MEERPPAFQRPHANSCVQGPTQSKWSLGSAPGATEGVLSHVLSPAKCASHRCWPSPHRLTPPNLHWVIIDIFPLRIQAILYCVTKNTDIFLEFLCSAFQSSGINSAIWLLNRHSEGCAKML